MSVTLRQLKAFLLVAEQNSFTKAAETLCLTQSALSGLIKELEQNLGVKLFDRTTRKLHLSDAGMRLLPQARRVLNENLEADLGVAPERVHSDDLQAVVLFSSPFYLVLPATHPFAKKDVLRWTDLLNERLITLNGPFIKSLQNELPAQISSRIFNSEFEVNFLSTALGMTRMGLGVTLCLLYAAEWVEQNGLVMRPIADPVVERKFLLYTHKNRSLSPAALAFKEFLEQNAHEFLVSHSKVSGI